MSLTPNDAQNYLKADDDDIDLVTELIETSQIYIDSMVGEAYKLDEKAVKLATLLQKKFIADMYDNRSTEIAANTKQDKIVTSILDKLSNYID